MYVSTAKEGDVFTLADGGKTIGTIQIKRRKGQLQLAFDLNGATVNKTSQHEVQNVRFTSHSD